MKDKAIFDEVNEKINRIKQKFSVKLDWENEHHGHDVDIVDVYTHHWQDATKIAENLKFKAIEEINPATPSNSVIFYAPEGAIIESHSSPQTVFCICLSGKLRITIDDVDNILEPIDSIYVKPNEMHEVEFLEASQAIVVWFPKLGIK